MAKRVRYGVATLLVFALELIIALYVHDHLIRPLVGDSLAVVLVYLALRTITRLRVFQAAVLALLIATALEFGQLFNLLDAIGLRHNRLARLVLGTTFDPMDLVAYTVGATATLACEYLRKRNPD